MSDTGDLLLTESQKAIDACFNLWKQRPRDPERIIGLKNAIDHLFIIELRRDDEHHAAAFGGAAGR